MVRIQIQLDPERHRELKRRAKDQGVSVAELVRRSIEADFEAKRSDLHDDRIRRARAVLGKYRDPSGGRATGRDHDAGLAEAYRR
jgi:post-segregation antitoxin (ccd killing protein)